MAALDMYVEREQWEKCLETAAKQVTAGSAGEAFKVVFCFGLSGALEGAKPPSSQQQQALPRSMSLQSESSQESWKDPAE